jgi:HKD family nuclease
VTQLRTLNELASKYVEPIFRAKKSAWVCSPWISKSYAEKLYDLSRRGVEVRIITSDDTYNADTYSYLSQLSQTTNFDVHFVKKGAVHSKIYVVDGEYAVTGAVNFTYTGLYKQTNNFTVAENEEVEPIVKDFMRLWIGFKSENVRPTQSTFKNMLPIMPYEKAVLVEIKNANILETLNAKLIINPYYKIQYSLLENVRLPWYQQTVVEDKGLVVIDANSGEVLNYNESTNYTSNAVIRELKRTTPLKEAVIDSSEKYDLENREWDIKVDNYKAEELARNYIKERNRKNIPYDDRRQGRKYQPYLPSDRAITILSKDLLLVPTWHFKYVFKDKNFARVILASSGEILASSFHKGGAICEDCDESISAQNASRCPICNKWFCLSEMVACSSCQNTFHKKHLYKTCTICNQILCSDCATVCPICNREYGKNHSVTCRDCGTTLCSNCIITSGMVLKKRRCPNCDVKSKKK